MKTIFFAALAFLAGCAVGPNYQRPEVSQPIPESFSTNDWKIAAPQSELPKGAWWKIFNDAELDRLEAEASDANQELKAAAARFAQAREEVNVARSGLFPHLSAEPGYSRSRSAVNGNKRAFSIPFDLSYEVDLWGRVRRDIEAGRAEEQA
jgi:multidrug efflux system outer membrane protein